MSSPFQGNGVFTLGNDGEADPATKGYLMNHVCLVVNDLEASKRFYGDCLGMRHMFTMDLTDEYSITYMGYPRGGADRLQFQSAGELLANKNKVEGLIEFLYNKNADKIKGSTGARTSFSHLGLMVPDVHQAQERMKSFGVRILKPLGQIIVPDKEVARAFGMGDGVPQMAAMLSKVSFPEAKDLFFAVDPDGNMVEVQQ